MERQFERTANLIGEQAIETLKHSAVLVFGLGGVGGHICEALVRSGIGRIGIVDKDVVDITNINRQIIATHDSVGRLKTEVMKERLLSIYPQLVVDEYPMFFLPENQREIDFSRYDYVVDAVDTVTAKICIITCSKEAGVPVISSMGTGNKLEPARFEVTDITKTSVCPLAKVMRKELKDRKISNVKVLYSKEEPKKSLNAEDARTPASIAYVPSVAGLMIAGEVIKDLVLKQAK